MLLSLLIFNCKNRKLLESNFTNSFNLFIKTNPCVDEGEIDDPDALFMNFTVNNFYFDLFKIDQFKSGNNANSLAYLSQIWASQNIVSKLARAPIDDGSKLTFAIYQQHSLLKAMFIHDKKTLYELKRLLISLTNKFATGQQLKMDIQSKYILFENRDEFERLSQLLLQKKAPKSEFSWLIDFFKKVKDQVSKSGNVIDEMSILSVSEGLFKQIDLTNEQMFTLTFLVNYDLILDEAYLKAGRL